MFFFFFSRCGFQVRVSPCCLCATSGPDIDPSRSWAAGHIPPNEKSYYSECVTPLSPLARGVLVDRNKFVRYVELSLRFQDTILGHLYGVSNLLFFGPAEVIPN
jgi:hypothetical protein